MELEYGPANPRSGVAVPENKIALRVISANSHAVPAAEVAFHLVDGQRPVDPAGRIGVEMGLGRNAGPERIEVVEDRLGAEVRPRTERGWTALPIKRPEHLPLRLPIRRQLVVLQPSEGQCLRLPAGERRIGPDCLSPQQCC